MKKIAKKTTANRHAFPAKQKRLSEQDFDTQSLDRDIPEEYRETIPRRMDEATPSENWSEAEDRGEDLANMRDPLVQEPERNTETPPELSQKRTGQTAKFDENLADMFDAERESEPPF